MTLTEVLERAARRDDSWAARWTAGRQAACRLAEGGVVAGDRVVLAHPDSEDLFGALVGCWLAGAVPAMVDPRADPAPFVADAQPRLVIDDLAALVAPGEPGAVRDGDERDPVYLSWTSGTTGGPKGAVLGAGPTALATACIADRLRLRPADVVLCATPAASSFQLVAAFLPAAHAGCRFVHAAGLSAQAIWQRIGEVGATVLVAYPLTLTEIVASAPIGRSTLRLAVSGGSPLPPAIKRAYRERLEIPLAESYGQSELGGFVALGDPVDGDPRAVTHVGRSLPDRPAWAEPDGEVVVAGQGMLGYLHRPEATVAVLAPPGVRTGDIGTSDRDGYLRVLGRRTDRLPDGRWPRDVDDALYDEPGVLHAAVVRLPTAEPRVEAVVQPRPGCQLSAATLQERTGVDAVHLVDAIPRTFSGKADRLRIARELASAHVC